MRTATVTYEIYTFDVLPPASQDKAIEDYQASRDSYSWADEWMESLKAFADSIGIGLTSWEINPYGVSFINWDMDTWPLWCWTSNPDGQLDDIKGLRLRTWIINNWLPHWEQGKYYSIDGPGPYFFSRRSKCQVEISCPLTGTCYDHFLIQPALDFISKPDPNMTLRQLINLCLARYITEYENDMRDQDSRESAIENITAMGFEFLKDGTTYP